MGTRNLTAVMVDREYKIAQYGQWDGHPDGQGLVALAFARKRLTTDEGRAEFVEQLKRVRFVESAEVEAMLAQIGSKDGFLTLDQSADWSRRWPAMSRDTAADVLELVATARGEVLTRNQIAFAGESLFCEWAWVIDITRKTFEGYKGFNHEPLASTERFVDAPQDERSKEYYPVKHVATWSLDALPTDADFLAAFKSKDDEDS